MPPLYVRSTGLTKEFVQSRTLPSGHKRLGSSPRKWELKSKRSTSRPETTISLSLSIPLTATTSPNGRSRSALKETFVPAPSELGLSLNSKS
jgi:hypothetical protein